MRCQLLSFLFGMLVASLPLLATYGWNNRQLPTPRVENPVIESAPGERESRRELIAGYKASSEKARDRLAFLESLDASQVTALLRAHNIPDPLEPKSKLPASLIALFERLAELDFDAAFTFAETEFPAGLRLELLQVQLLQWAVEDPDTCQDWIDRSSDQMEEETPKQWKRFLDTHAELRVSCEATDQEIARQWKRLFSAQKIDGAFSSAALGAVVTFENQLIAKLDPIIQEAERNNSWKATIERLFTIPYPSHMVIAPVAKAWRDKDLQGALDWVESLPAGKIRDDVITWGIASIGSSDADVDFAKLFDWLVRVKPSAVFFYIDDWAEHEPDAAAKWILENDVPPEQITQFAVDLADRDMAAALAIAKASEGERGNLADSYSLTQILQNWSRSEPWAAAAWARENLEWSEEQLEQKFGEFR